LLPGAIEADPSNPDTYYEYGLFLLFEGNTAEGDLRFLQSLLLQPNMSHTLEHYASFLGASSDMGKQFLERAAKLKNTTT
jgi:hypothetical protein